MSIVRQSKELYLALFVVLFRISRWRATAKVSSAIVGLSVVDSTIALIFFSWVEIVAGRRLGLLNFWFIGIALFPIYFINHYVLIVRGHGMAFERKFNDFAKNRRVALRLIASGLFVITYAALFFTIAVYQQTFHIAQIK